MAKYQDRMTTQNSKKSRRFQDYGSKYTAQQLQRFKERREVRVLLLSMSTGGVGLNISEANHGFFLDVWCA